LGGVYLTLLGTSAEDADSGQVGRGNRVNGLITPYRPMNMEAAAGKNPVTHVGKLYNIAAQRIASLLVARLPDIQEAQCYLVSRIGHPVTQPQVVDIRVRLADARLLAAVETDIRDLVADQLQQIPRLQDQFLAGEINIY
jgi:S-adenosylmethionine synthetase